MFQIVNFETNYFIPGFQRKILWAHKRSGERRPSDDDERSARDSHFIDIPLYFARPLTKLAP
jgi:hypothetical protein